jgi:hypothetical protein
MSLVASASSSRTNSANFKSMPSYFMSAPREESRMSTASTSPAKLRVCRAGWKWVLRSRVVAFHHRNHFLSADSSTAVSLVFVDTSSEQIDISGHNGRALLFAAMSPQPVPR